MNGDLKAKRPGANRTRRRQRNLTNGQLQYTTYTPHLSSLLDLAEHTIQKQLLRAERFQALADAHRRRAWAAMDALREYQKLLSEGQQ